MSYNHIYMNDKICKNDYLKLDTQICIFKKAEPKS